MLHGGSFISTLPTSVVRCCCVWRKSSASGTSTPNTDLFFECLVSHGITHLAANLESTVDTSNALMHSNPSFLSEPRSCKSGILYSIQLPQNWVEWINWSTFSRQAPGCPGHKMSCCTEPHWKSLSSRKLNASWFSCACWAATIHVLLTSMMHQYCQYCVASQHCLLQVSSLSNVLLTNTSAASGISSAAWM